MSAAILPVTPVERRKPVVPNAVLGMLIFLFTEVMIFCALISAYVVVRTQWTAWPPLDQPRLPVLATLFNTGLLLASGITMWRSVNAFERDGQQRLVRLLGVSLALGAAFLCLQGFEWVSLIRFGLTTTSSVYGAFFYTIVGCHALHVLIALVALFGVYRRAKRGGYKADDNEGLLAMRLYWTFVVGVWPPVYLLVYVW